MSNPENGSQPQVVAAAQSRLFHFGVPGLTQVRFVMPLAQVLNVGAAPAVRPIPMHRSGVYGLGMWQGNIVTVLDLATVLQQTRPTSVGYLVGQQAMFTQTVIEGQRQLLAWPVSPGVGTIYVASKLQTIDPPEDIPSSVAHTTFSLDDQPTVLLNLNGLFSLLQSASS